jgi:hypothetical protein
MTRENLFHQRDACCGRYIWEPNDSGMHRACDIDERSEIGIDRHENASFFGRQLQ